MYRTIDPHKTQPMPALHLLPVASTARTRHECLATARTSSPNALQYEIQMREVQWEERRALLVVGGFVVILLLAILLGLAMADMNNEAWYVRNVYN